MKIKTLVDVLRARDSKFYASAADIPERVHIRHERTIHVLVPVKGRKGNYNRCDVAFAHLYEKPDTDELFWLSKATHSGTIIGHKCIPDIFHNVLTSTAVKFGSSQAKKILESELPEIVDILTRIDKFNLKLEDVDFNP